MSGLAGTSDPLRIALLTYSTRPRGGVVATLALAEALARAGHHVDLWTLARGGDRGFYRPVDPAVRVRAVPFPEVAGESVGPRILRSIAVLREAFAAGSAALAADRTGDGSDGARTDEAGYDGTSYDGTSYDGTSYDGTSYDIVHAQDCISANAVDDCLRTVHHLDTFTTPELVACHERALRRPYAHICVSAAVAADLARGWGITATVIPNGVDASRFTAAAGPSTPARAARADWRARLGRYVLSVGGIEPRKGTLDLVEAFALLRAGRPGATGPVSLVLAGGETLFDYRAYRERVFARARDLGVEPVVLGPVDHASFPALVAAADVFAFPSAQEGFGLAALEALAAGVPVVARELPVLREVLGEAGDAVRFAATPARFAAALAEFLRHGNAAPDLTIPRTADPRTADPRTTDPRTADPGAADPGGGRVGAGRALAERFSWDSAARRHLGLYRTLIGARAHDQPRSS